MIGDKKIALITGAGSGIGRAVAYALDQQGWTLVLAGRRLENLQGTAEMCEGKEAMAVACDITSAEGVRSLFRQIEVHFGRLDLLFNNAGINAPYVPLEELSLEVWQRVVDTNLTGAFLCTQEAFRLMKKQQPAGGRIINNGSISAHVPRPLSIAYTATKHAVTGLTKSTSLDGRRYGITCGQIDVGNAATAMTQKMSSGVLQADGTIKPEPTMDMADVGRAVAYMAGLPADTNIPFMTIMANGMPYMGRG
ncbi:putative oxidoreductase [Lunatimonas lonarensis]|uniref:Putative oxidoreductase n=1 Tax=Lunatimonas lonarensis TaxID=1232681 RepID=R7ZQW7_9BACT|nr:SDR family oxidoreductase [Lunatimonas lonarensis]EON76510.1 putative oxidoreductase [Lunatimonas lonarensis]